MKWVTLLAVIGLGGAAAPAQEPAQSPTRAPARRAAAALDCRECHTAATPTKSDPALAACPRLLIKGYHGLDEAPATITLGAAGGVYGAVKFSHRDHARMAETGKGCSGCHHYDQARAIQKCEACHSTSRTRADLGKPDLRAALHRQCLECHQDWNAAVTCATCHETPAGRAAAATAKAPVKPPKAAAPVQVVYETRSMEGKTVTFFHKDHTDRFALPCADCHRQESCATCHGVKAAGGGALTFVSRRTRPGATHDEAHARCASCHAADACATCHTGTAVRTAGFDHKTRTGWALNRFHATLACQQCHTAPGKFVRLNADCEGCHKGCQAKFDHARTGLALDELHAGADCVSCHEDKQFIASPTCGGCHTDKSYPAQKPGKRVAGRAARK